MQTKRIMSFPNKFIMLQAVDRLPVVLLLIVAYTNGFSATSNSKLVFWGMEKVNFLKLHYIAR